MNDKCVFEPEVFDQ